MFLYHWVSLPRTGINNISCPRIANQTGRGRDFPLFLPITVKSISFRSLQEKDRLSTFKNRFLSASVQSQVKKAPLTQWIRFGRTEELRVSKVRFHPSQDLSGLPL